MLGFLIAALIAMFCFLVVTAEDWWQSGRQILCRVLVFAALALAVTGIHQVWWGS